MPTKTRMANCHPTEKHFSRGFCRKCYQRAYIVRNRLKIRAQSRISSKRRYHQRKLEDPQFLHNKNISKHFSLSGSDYQDLLLEQNGVCAICHKPETVRQSGKVCRLAVDHDHKTGVIRGLLCRQCNTGLGSFKDTPELLDSAKAYLNK